MAEYNHLKIERKWQKEWEKKKIYYAQNNSKKRKYYSLIEFPYPSGDGLHVGHPRPYIGMDVISRKRRMQGFNVLYPIGWDAFGLPTENYAIKTGQDPRVVTKQNSDTFRRQIKSLGISFDWSREINTTDPKYYKWTQWIFLQFFKKSLAYKVKMTINWCPSCKIGLANEEVINGCCERCGTPVEKREKEQWMLAITKYADRLYKDLDDVDYLPQIKLGQRNWIGRSEGVEIEFKISVSNPTYPLTPSQREGEFGYYTTDAKTWRALQGRVLEMRKNPTATEDKLWQQLRKNNLTSTLPKGEEKNPHPYHFRRQHIIGRFVVDFVCLEKSLIVEVDGDIHDYQKKEDEERTDFLKQNGFRVIRFHNDEVLKDVNEVVKKISEELKALPFGEGLGGVIRVFTTRPDTLFGAFAIILAPEHELIKKLQSQIQNWAQVEKYVKEVKKKTDIERTDENKEKTGVELKGIKAINPANNEEIPIWIADFILVQYGTGAVFADMHDERDFEFAKKYNLPIKTVIVPYFRDADNPPQEGKRVVSRKAVECYVFNPRNSKYLCLDWKNVDWRTPVTGGVESNESLENAGYREVHEETGYKNLKFIKTFRSPILVDFYHPPKDENRKAEFYGVLFELIDEAQDSVSKEESALHSYHWIEKNKVLDFINKGRFFFKQLMEGKESAYTGEGVLINSGEFNGLHSDEAIKKITKFVGGKMVTKFKLRDWIFSRQRYWGEPIPVINCEKCGSVPVPEKDLPVELPKVKNYQPTDSGESPLANISKWVNVKCPKCGGKAKRETDTMPNWAGSSWYYLRYTDPKNKKEFASQKNLKYWLTPSVPPPKGEVSNFSLPFGEGQGGVDWYNGGNEHTTLHLLYSRFWHKFLYDLKLVPTAEPYLKRTSHGLILAESEEKMSKSKGNVINPDDIVKIYGADTLRLYEMFMGPFDQAIAWSEEAIIGPRRFLERVWQMSKTPFDKNMSRGVLDIERLLHKTIKKVSEDIEEMKFNTAISTLMIFMNEVEKFDSISQDVYEKFLKLLSPFAPHITEELWQKLAPQGLALGSLKARPFPASIHLSDWPKWDKNLIKDEEVKIAVQINGKVRAEIMIQADEKEKDVKKKALENQAISKYTKEKDIKRVIYVKNRLINIVL